MLQDDKLNGGSRMGLYSFGLFKSSNNGLQYWHRGSLFGFKSIISFYPEKDFGIVILGNVQTFERRRYAREITRLFHPELAPIRSTAKPRFLPTPSTEDRAVDVRAGNLGEYTGHYVADPMTVYVVEKQRNSLVFSLASDSKSTTLVPLGADEFWHGESSMVVAFSRNGQGLVDRLICRTASGETSAAKSRELTASRRGEYIGEYYCEELQVSIRITESERGLVARNLRLGEIEMFSTHEDEFRCSHDFFSYISFYRDADARVDGFLLDGFSVSDLRFTREP
jgi:hypothetical protein